MKTHKRFCKRCRKIFESSCKFGRVCKECRGNIAKQNGFKTKCLFMGKC